MMIDYDIYDHFTMEHFPLRQSMILTTSFFCSRQYFYIHLLKIKITIYIKVFHSAKARIQAQGEPECQIGCSAVKYLPYDICIGFSADQMFYFALLLQIFMK
jgi:hypothetical protein